MARCPALWSPHFRDRTRTVSNPQEDSTGRVLPQGLHREVRCPRCRPGETWVCGHAWVHTILGPG